MNAALLRKRKMARGVLVLDSNLAGLAPRLNDRAPAETDRYARSVRNLNGFVRVGYELCIFAIICLLAFQAMVLKRNLMIMHESATTGLHSRAPCIFEYFRSTVLSPAFIAISQGPICPI